MRNNRRPAALDVPTLVYLVLLTALIVVFRRRLEHWWLWAGLHAGLAVLVAALVQALPRRAPGWTGTLRLWYPLVLVPILFRALETLVPAVHGRDYDPELASLDRALFGVDPALWLQPLARPWLTELLQLAYVSFYALPIALGLALFRRRRLAEFETAAATLTGGFFASFLLYFALPALGPRFYLASSFDPLPSFAASAAVRRWLNLLEGIQRDAFPSGHTAVALICLGLALRYDKRLAAAMAPAVALIPLSAVYLRYHYVVDLIAGGLLAAVALVAAARLDARRRRDSPAGATDKMPP